jgi:GAF domain-containing protein
MASTQHRQPVNANEALERLRRLSLRETSMEALLQAVAEVAKQVIPGNPETSVTVLVGRIPTTVVSTGALAHDCDESQYERGDGPCLNAATSGELTEIADTLAEPRWRDYVEEAAERGALSLLSVPLPIGEGRSAALNIYARTANAFNEDSRSVAVRLAPYAAVAITNMHAYQDARNMTENLHVALDSRAVIEQAKGILMERHKMTAERAFQTLTQASMKTNTKLLDVAGNLVHTGELPLE